MRGFVGELKNNIKMKIEKLDTIIVSQNHSNKLFAGKIGFVIEVRNDNDEKEQRYDVQFPFDPIQTNFRFSKNMVFEQYQFSCSDITILQKAW